MSKIELNPITEGYADVNYMDHEFTIPAHHIWMAITRVQAAGGGVHTYLASFADKPVLNKDGYYTAEAGTDFAYIVRIADTSAGDSLVQVQKPKAEDSNQAETPAKQLYMALEVFASQLEELLESEKDIDEVVHAAFCPEHGMIPNFVHNNMKTIRAEFGMPNKKGMAISEALAHVLADVTANASSKDAAEQMVEDIAEHLGAKVIKFN